MAAAPAKFRFDLDLGHRQERNTVVTESGLAMLISAARGEGRAEGLAEKERSDAVRQADRLATAAEMLADRVASMSAALDDHRTTTLAEALGVASAIGRKLAHHLLAAQPAAEIEALIEDCLASLGAVPHLVARCAPDLAEAVRDIAQARIGISGFTGRLVVLGDPDLGPDDARIEWADGGLVRDRAGLEAEIERRIADYVAARRGHAKGSTP
jgi:flagellar assembly protein FliH